MASLAERTILLPIEMHAIDDATYIEEVAPDLISNLAVSLA